MCGVQNDATQPSGKPDALNCTLWRGVPCTVSLYLIASALAVGSDGPRHGARLSTTAASSIKITF